MAARWAATAEAVKLAETEESSLQKFLAHDGEVSQLVTQVCTMEAKLKSLPPIETETSLTLWVVAKFWSISAWPCWPPLL